VVDKKKGSRLSALKLVKLCHSRDVPNLLNSLNWPRIECLDISKCPSEGGPWNVKELKARIPGLERVIL
jgi:hypothetical protein